MMYISSERSNPRFLRTAVIYEYDDASSASSIGSFEKMITLYKQESGRR